MTPRFIILNSIPVAVLGLMGMGGLLDGVLHWITGAGVCLILLALMAGLIDVSRGRIESAKWFEGLLPYLGLGMTVLGLILAFGSIDMTAETAARIATVQRGISVSLHSTLATCAALIWLRINIRFLGRVDG